MSLRKRIQILLAFLVGLPLLLLLYESYQTGRKTLVAEMTQEAAPRKSRRKNPASTASASSRMSTYATSSGR